MTESEWLEFLSTGNPLSVPVTRLPSELTRLLHSDTDRLTLRHDYAMKSMVKHRLQPYHFPMLPITVDLGRIILQPLKSKHLNFFYRDDVVFGTWFKAVVKTNSEMDELHVATFHRVHSDEVARWVRRYGTHREQRIT
jgi:hypothetical protein